MIDDLLTRAEAAAILGVSIQRVDQLRRAQKISARKLGSIWVFTKANIEAHRDTAKGKPGRPRLAPVALVPPPPVPAIPVSSGQTASETAAASEPTPINPDPKKPKSVKSAPGTRLTEDWWPPDAWVYEAVGKRPELKPEIRTHIQEFRNYFTGPDATRPVKKDWRAAFRIWMSRCNTLPKKWTPNRFEGHDPMSGELAW